jgi:lysophospholipase L1-like esterase
MLGQLGRVLIALWHVVGLLLIAALIIELGIDVVRRLSRWLRHHRVDRPDSAALADANAGADWAVGYFDEFRRAIRVDWRAHVGWWQRPTHGHFVTIDARGLRPTPGEDNPDPDAIHILCFGGSTTMGMGARDAATIPAVLARRLGEVGHRVVLTNYGQLGHNLTQELITLQQVLKSGARIDIAVFYDGVNEMACAEQTGRADGLFNEARRRAEFNLLHPERWDALIAAAGMALLPRTLRYLRRLTGSPLRGPFPALETDLSQRDLAALASAVVANYFANLQQIRLLAAGYGFRVVFFWQPVITTKLTKSRDEQRFAADYTHQLDERRRLYNAVIDQRRVHPGLEAAADVVDLSALFDEVAEPVYIDLYHLSEGGNAAVAEAMLPTVAALVGAIVKGR